MSGSVNFTDNSCSGWFQYSVPLGQDGISGSIPLPWSHKSKLVWGTRTKVHLQGQLGISQEEPWYVRLGSYEGAQLVQVCDVICLQRLALAKPEERKEHIEMTCKQKHQFLIFCLRKVAFSSAPPVTPPLLFFSTTLICSLTVNDLSFFSPSWSLSKFDVTLGFCLWSNGLK